MPHDFVVGRPHLSGVRVLDFGTVEVEVCGTYRTAATRLRHPVDVALHTNAPLGVRIAIAVTGFTPSRVPSGPLPLAADDTTFAPGPSGDCN
jgi:hypothetical protein